MKIPAALVLLLLSFAGAAPLGSSQKSAAIPLTGSNPVPRAAEVSGSADLRAENLRCEYLVGPLGIDVARPRLSWTLASKRRAERQSAYQVLVAAGEAGLDARVGAADRGDLWDSGRVASDQSIHIEYAGKELASGQRCWWKVRVWDRDGRASGWSRPAFWQMGLLKAADWKARWIAAPATSDAAPTLEGASWVWFPESGGDPVAGAPPGIRVFRRRITLPEAARIARARMVLAADDRWAIRVNGQYVRESGMEPEEWRTVGDVDLTNRLRPGANVVGVRARNTQQGPAGLIGKIVVTFENGEQRTFPVDETWRALDTEPQGWARVEFDDAAWPHARRIAAFGQGPWGRLAVGGEMQPSPYLRKVFTLNKPVRRATIHATALGLYELRLNGRRVGDAHLAPGWTDYNKRVAYQTYDVTGALRRGDNVLGAILGDGWYCGHVGFGNHRREYGSRPQLLAQLWVEYADGTQEIVATDDSWRATTEGPIRGSDLQMGERYDARREMPGWDAPGFAPGNWMVAAEIAEGPRPGAVLVAERAEPVRVTEEIRPKSLSEPRSGVYVFDMGQNLVGWVRLRVRGNAGATIRLRHAEMLNPDGTIYTANLRAAGQTDTYVLRGDAGAEVWEPRFTFHGFRYVEITGFPGKPTREALVARVAHSDTPRVGRMETSNGMVNRLLQNIDWGQRGNFLSIPTDCPQRDERLGWTGDAQIFVRTATYNRDVAAFFTKWTQDLEDAQSAEGAFPDVAPRQHYVGEGVAAWGDAGVICPWTIYLVYGDRRLLAERYDSMVRWVEYCRKHSQNLLRPAHGYGDWLSINAETPKEVLATAYFARSTDLVARAAKVLGKDEDARKYARLFEEIKSAFNKAYVAEDGRIKGDTQTVYVLALRFGLLPESRRAAAARRLVDDIRARNDHLSTGFVGVGYLCPTLTENGHADVAYTLLANDTFPSWGYSIRHGATTIWERWDGWTEERGFQDPGMNSFNHYSLGSVGEWLFADVAGIDTSENGPGYKRIVIRPHIAPNGLTHVKSEYASIHGRIATEWKRENGAFALRVVIPANTTATVYVPARENDAVLEGRRPAGEAEGVTFLRRDNGYAIYAVGSGAYAFQATQARASHPRDERKAKR